MQAILINVTLLQWRIWNVWRIWRFWRNFVKSAKIIQMILDVGGFDDFWRLILIAR